MSDPRCHRPTLRPLVLAFVLLFLLHRMGRAEWVQTLTAESPRTPKIFAMTVSGPHLLVGFESGIFRSSDQGNTWIHPRLGMSDFGTVFSLASRGSTVYGGTVGAGMYRSVDAGLTWSESGLTGQYVTSIVPVDGALLATTCCHGLFRSTDDGAAWTRPSSANADSLDIGSIGLAGAYLLGGSPRGLYRSADQGATWTHVLFAAGLSDSAVGPFAALGTTLFAGAHKGLYRSQDNGSTWTRTALEISYLNVLAAADRDLFVASGSSLLRSPDRGDTWISIDSGLAPALNYPPNTFCLAFSGGNLFAGVSQAGVWRRALSEFGTAIVPFRPPGFRANIGHSGRPGFIPEVPGLLRTERGKGFHLNGRQVLLPQRLMPADRAPLPPSE